MLFFLFQMFFPFNFFLFIFEKKEEKKNIFRVGNASSEKFLVPIEWALESWTAFPTDAQVLALGFHALEATMLGFFLGAV